MRSLSTLATLLLGLAIVFWVSAAKADCPHNDDDDDDDTHQHCSGGTSTNTGPYEFVGYSSMSVVGDVGIPEIYKTCQNDFGPEARMCTRIEFYYSPNAVSPFVEAWVDTNEIPGSFPCDFWTSTSKSDGTTVQDVSGKFILREVSCSSDLLVTCCARLQ